MFSLPDELFIINLVNDEISVKSSIPPLPIPLATLTQSNIEKIVNNV